MRRLLALAVALACALTLVTAPADAAPRRHRLPALGYQYHGLWSGNDPARQEAVLSRIAASGATWVRIDLSWAMLEPQPGAYDLAWGVPRTDALLRRAHAHGLKVLAIFWLTPGWANGDAGERTPPSDPGTYATALRWAAERWRTEVDAWEVWNEPNGSDFFTRADPAEYVRMLCPAYAGVKAADPRATVVFGGLMYSDFRWLRRAYKAGAKGCFDALGVHPYMAPSDAPPGLPPDRTGWRLRDLSVLRAVMLRFGDRRPMWATELGWSAHGGNAGMEPWRRGVSRRTQARYAVQAVAILRRRHPYVRTVFWYKADVDPVYGGQDPHQDGYAVLNPDLSPRPVYRALRRVYTK